MRFVYETVVGSTGGPLGNGISVAVPCDVLLNPFSVSVGVIITGSANVTIQHTFDDVWAVGFVPGTANWLAHTSLQNVTASIDGNYAFPVRAIRGVVNSGTGTLLMQLGQSGI
jgi:hypothetical protein